jgi:hypothetical protein
MDRKARVELLFHCLGMRTSQTDNMGAEDWEAVVQLSERHNVAPLLYYELKNSHQCLYVPDEIKQKLRESYLCNSWQNTQRYNDTSIILKSLQNAGIQVIALKGIALAELVYKNIALRPMEDVDLLVRRSDFHKLDGVFSELGYKNVTVLLSKRHINWVRHLNYSKGNGHIEVHPEIAEKSDMDPWMNAVSARIAGTRALTLGAEDFVIHLCLHLEYHLRTSPVPLIWWIDIKKILEHYENTLNWDRLLRIAKEHKTHGIIHRMLKTVKDEFNTNIPADTLAQLSHDGMALSMEDLLFLDKAGSQNVNRMLLFTSRAPTLPDKAYHIFRRLFPSRDFMMRNYSIRNPKLLYFYYFLPTIEAAIKLAKAIPYLPGYLYARSVKNK